MTFTRELRLALIAAAVLALGPGAMAAPGAAWRGEARSALERGDLDAAAQVYNRALAADGDSAELWVEIGRLRYRTGQHHQALAASVKAVELGPRHPEALEFRGQLARDAAGPVAALPWFERAIEATPDDLDLLGEYAATLAEAGRNRDMLRVARRMVELDPRHPRAYFLQAVLAARTGHDRLALSLLNRTGGTYAGVPAGRLLAGILELRTGSPALAVEHFDALARRQPDNAAAAALLGRALLANGEAREVVARLGPAADRADASPYLLTLVGRAYEQLGRREEAARFLDRAAAPQPAAMAVLPVDLALGEAGQAEATVPLLRRLLAQGRRGEAMAQARQLNRRYPGSADVQRLTGDVALLAGEPAAALGQYALAAQVRRDFALVERMVAALRLMRREPEARDLLADYLANNPRSGPAAALLGRMLAQAGDPRRGALLLNHVLAVGGGGDPRLLADLALAELALGEPKVAQATAQRAHALQRSNGRVAAVLARTLEARRPAALARR